MSNYSVRGEISSEVTKELETYPEIVRHLLFHRGIVKKEDAEKFLKPDYERDIHDPYLLKDMKKAVERILSAISKEEKILIYGDYDADGIPGSVILHDFFKKIGYKNFENYFPHRHDEGYGLNMEAVEQFKNDNVNLIITIDCGTADVLQVAKAQEYGIDVIITDHHLSEKIPPAYAIINSKQLDCDYPYDMLCGSGVIFKLIQAILKKNNFGIKEGMEKWHLDMVGLATMADMVPLQGENRALAFFGLKILRLSPRIGLKKLLQKNKITQRYLCEDDIGFTIAPRINAASRMGDPMQAFQLLTSTNEADAENLADYLNKKNDERKSIAAVIAKEVKKVIKKRTGSDGIMKKVLVIGNPDWKPALLGPVANNLAEEFNVPVFLWGRADGEFIKGSCRSDGKINLSELMEHTPPDLFLTYGGHKMSGGFSISHEKIHLLENELCKAYEILNKEGIVDDELFVDLKLSVDDVNWATHNSIEQLSPFGVGNEKPLFLFENIIIDEVKLFGKEKNHLELIFRNNEGKKVSAIGFFMTPKNFSMPILRGEKINLVATMEKSMFRNFPELRLRIVDVI